MCLKTKGLAQKKLVDLFSIPQKIAEDVVDLGGILRHTHVREQVHSKAKAEWSNRGIIW